MNRQSKETKHGSLIEIKIDKLVLHGFRYGDKNAIAESIKAELGRLFNNSEMNHVFKKNISLSGINAGSINISHSSNSAVTGTKAAGAVYNGILNSVSPNKRSSK